MQNLTQIIRSELSGVLPVHMINFIAPKLAKRIKEDSQHTVIQEQSSQGNGNVLRVSQHQGRTSPQYGEVQADELPTFERSDAG